VIRWFAILGFALFLAACGVDGEPSAPTEPTISGGVTISNSGVYPYANVGVSNGPVSVNVGLGNWGWGYWL
jgi:hypothetical protein